METSYYHYSLFKIRKLLVNTSVFFLFLLKDRARDGRNAEVVALKTVLQLSIWSNASTIA